MSNAISTLFRSRKFLLALFAVIQTVVFHFIPSIDPELWQAINVLVIVLIGTIAIEDAAEKHASGGGEG
jgi:hypothetical protein